MINYRYSDLMWNGFSLYRLSQLDLRLISHSMAWFSHSLSSRFAARHRDPDTGAAQLAGMTAAFSLIELSIVLVILGLLTGGILMGQNLIRNAELKAITADVEKFANAAELYQEKYLELPGDHSRATANWGIRAGATGSDATCYTATSTGEATCNGNGDGAISADTTGTYWTEFFLAWQHLSNAGMVNGQFTGIASDSATGLEHRAGVNAPTGPLNNSTYVLWTERGRNVGQTGYFDARDGEVNINTILFGGELAGTFPGTPVLTPEEAWGIDTKLDDGNPAYGKVFAPAPTSTNAPNCTTGTGQDSTTAAYNLSNDSTACFLGWYRVF